MEANQYLAFAILLTGTAFVTIWFSQGLLNTFLKNVFAIIICALYITASPFVWSANRVYFALKKNIYDPIQKIIRHIHIPLGIKIVLYLIIGVGILLLDYFYNTKIYEADETTFYHILFQGKTYWITKDGLIFGGFFIGLGVFLLVIQIWKIINKLIDRPIDLVITFQK